MGDILALKEQPFLDGAKVMSMIRQYEIAEKEFDTIAASHLLDNWGSCNFFTLFQLASLQRKSRSPAAYLQTLIRCFSNSIMGK